LLAEGFTQYSARQFDKSHTAADEYIRKNPNAANLDEAYYLRGLSRISRNEKPAAAQDLQAAISKTKRADLKAKANRALGDIAYDAARWQDAIACYQISLATAPPSPVAGVHINYRLGTCHQNLGQFAISKPYFQKIITPPLSNTDPAYLRSALVRIEAKVFSLQFGAFRDQPNAAALVQQLKPALTATIATELRDNQLLYLVRTGSYPTLAEAQSARARLLAKYPNITIAP